MAHKELSSEHLEQLSRAKRTLEGPGLGMRLTNVLGRPFDVAVDSLPVSWREGIVGISRKALATATDLAFRSIAAEPTRFRGERLHRMAVTLTGAAGGAFGLPALSLELPVSTTLMLRSIADIAREEGENLEDPAAKIHCMAVFALGGRTLADDAAESAYYVARVALARTVGELGHYLARGGSGVALPAMIRFISTIASRYQLQVAEKVAAQAVPILGVAGGAVINNLFIGHFQDVGRGHFTVRRLERIYSPGQIAREYDRL
jgi:hypothetical protein